MTDWNLVKIRKWNLFKMCTFKSAKHRLRSYLVCSLLRHLICLRFFVWNKRYLFDLGTIINIPIIRHPISTETIKTSSFTWIQHFRGPSLFLWWFSCPKTSIHLFIHSFTFYSFTYLSISIIHLFFMISRQSIRLWYPFQSQKRFSFIIVLNIFSFFTQFTQSRFTAYCLMSAWKNYSTKACVSTLVPRLLYITYREF